MKKETRLKFNAYLERQAELNGIDPINVYSTHEVEPSVQQKLFEKLQQDSSFLDAINIIFKDELVGETIGMEAADTIASTTDTDGEGERKTTDIAKLVAQQYFCKKVNFDTHIKHSRLDSWAKFKDFQTRISSVKAKRIKLDLIMAGMNGVKRAPTSDRAKNKLLQDVAVGWLQKIRLNAPECVMGSKTTGDETVAAPIKVGKGQEYQNLDALIMDATEELIGEVYKEDTDLVCIVGRKLLADKYFPVVNQDNKPSEMLAAEMVISQKRIGNLPAVRVPYFPANAVLITKLENLSLYVQEGGSRAHIEDVAKKDRVEFYQSENIDYVVEDYECAALIENITFEDKDE
ncbi:phage major capsid protein, P2 family [Actinobacillus lignieresii]|uniref:phage major capsid protein, P2 family n=1 Tax=Actinobacillus lignieresii TaxID=720 RepID=UPI000F7191B6|nr:phage major capsid protein, P2 family [Actinobacillus lignieresii]VEB25912.1 phage major capsid protein, P2 family [Actinobacillus lignieresii]